MLEGVPGVLHVADLSVVCNLKFHPGTAHDHLVIATASQLPSVVRAIHYQTDIVEDAVADALSAILKMAVLALVSVPNLATDCLEGWNEQIVQLDGCRGELVGEDQVDGRVDLRGVTFWIFDIFTFHHCLNETDRVIG